MSRTTHRSQSERVTAGSDSTTSNNGNSGNVVLVDMRPAEDAEFGLDEVMERALREVSGVRSPSSSLNFLDIEFLFTLTQC